ncbi:MAG: hypothetical protein HC927_13760 [Deltaproteobacteria bacterium]|nr:hypothetical protein [Deltaproteobacteria bacterium]
MRVIDASVCDEDEAVVIVEDGNFYLVRPDRYLWLLDEHLTVAMVSETKTDLVFEFIEGGSVDEHINGSWVSQVIVDDGIAIFDVRRFQGFVGARLSYRFDYGNIPTIPELDVEPLPNCPPDEYTLVEDPEE